MTLDGSSQAAAEVAAANARPPSVSKAVRLLWAAFAIGPARAALEFARLSDMASPPFVFVVQLFTFAVMALLVLQIGRRRNWARIVWTVLFVLGLPFSVKPLIESLQMTPVSGILGVVQVALQAVATVLLFTFEARAWFAARRRAQATVPRPPPAW